MGEVWGWGRGNSGAELYRLCGFLFEPPEEEGKGGECADKKGGEDDWVESDFIGQATGKREVGKTEWSEELVAYVSGIALEESKAHGSD